MHVCEQEAGFVLNGFDLYLPIFIIQITLAVKILLIGENTDSVDKKQSSKHRHGVVYWLPPV